MDLFIAEKPSVGQAFAKVLHATERGNGYMSGNGHIVTWCIGHLVRLSYPEVYDAALKKWSMSTLPFMPDHYKYEVIPEVADQFK
jgi:DNA topoisomerase-3